jgi:hypothetical protein
MAEGEISIGGALSFAWSLLSHHWRAIWGILALNALSWTVLYAGSLGVRPELVVAGTAAVFVTQYPLFAAVFRLGGGVEGADNPDFRLGALGIQWRRMEFRLLLANLLQFVFMFIAFMVIMVALLALVMGVIMANGVVQPAAIKTQADMLRALGPQGPQILWGCQLVVVLTYLFLSIRLFLTWPASALSGRVAVLRTWGLTRGAFFKIFGAYLLVQIPLLVTQMMLSAVLTGQIATLSPGQILGYSVLSGVMAGGASMPLSAGLQAYFYKALGPLPPDAPKGTAG